MFLILQIICSTLSTFLLFVGNFSHKSLTIRETLNGPVEGIAETSILGQKYFAFRGIPFAEPPITGRDPYTGEHVDRRFKAPEPLLRRWAKPLKVQKFANLCIPSRPIPDELSRSFSFSEDCLYLDVYIPSGGAAKKPVVLYIHGIGVAGGTADDKQLGPDFLLAQDSIVVKLAHRSQIFGWLDLGYGNYTGNMALKDQQLGIKWVYENIENFSGNKNAILIFGHSLGGLYVNYQMLNKESRRYFTRAYCLSGTAFNTFYNMEPNDQLQLAKNCFRIHDTEGLIAFLTTANVSSLIKCNILDADFKGWLPTIEQSNVPAAFLTKTPDEIYNSDEAPIIDAMYSVTSQEGIRINKEVFEAKTPLLPADWRKTNVPLLVDDFTRSMRPNISPRYFDKKAVDLLRNAYFTNSTNVHTIQNENVAFHSDLHIRFNTLKAAILQTKANNNKRINKSGNTKTFFFRFSVNTDINPFQISQNITYSGATHSDELPYIFYLKSRSSYREHLKQKDKVYDLIMRTTKYIVNFARTGNPTIEHQTPFENCKSADKIYCTEITNDLKSSVTADIKKQLHYQIWLEVENLYKNTGMTMHRGKN